MAQFLGYFESESVNVCRCSETIASSSAGNRSMYQIVSGVQTDLEEVYDGQKISRKL